MCIFQSFASMENIKESDILRQEIVRMNKRFSLKVQCSSNFIAHLIVYGNKPVSVEKGFREWNNCLIGVQTKDENKK